MKQLERKLIKEIGEPCPDYSMFCFKCIIWDAFYVIKEALEITK